MIRILHLPVLATSALVVLGGCSLTREPMEQPGTWQPTGANEHNLRAMVVNPSHLERGIGASTDRAQPGSLAVTRLTIDRRRRLPVVETSEIAARQAAQDPPATGPGIGTSNAGGGGASR